MEFKDFLKLISKKRKLLLGWWLSLVVIGFLIVALLPEKKIATLSVDIGRDQQKEQAGEYQYDQFYRLEADDRFANTIVEWSKDPNVQRVIFEDVKSKLDQQDIERAINSLRAEKKSATLVQITYAISAETNAAPFAKSIYDVFVEKTNSLNSGNEHEGWFRIIGSGPTVREKSTPFILLFVIFACGSLLISLFIVLLKHYFKEEEKPNEDWI